MIKKKIKVMEHYSGKPPKCQICKETEIQFLSFDHIEGRKSIGHKRGFNGEKLAIWLIKNNFPKGFQILCMNCNCAKKFAFDLKPDPIKYKNRDEKRYYEGRKFHNAIKENVLKFYSHDANKPKCICCGKDRIEWLTIDHINGSKENLVQNRIGGIKL